MSGRPEIAVACAECVATSGSVATVAIHQAAELAKRFAVTILSDRLPQPQLPGVGTVAVAERRYTFLGRLAHVPAQYLFARRVGRALARRHREQPLAAVICHSHALATAGALPFGRRTGVPYALVTHGDIFDRPAGTYDPRLTWFFRRMTPPAYRHAGRVLALSPHMAACARRGGAAEARIRLVPNGIDPAAIGIDPERSTEPRGARPAGEPVRLLFVGSLGVQKGVDTLLEAGGRLAAAGTPFELLLVGDGPRRAELEASARRAGLGERVRFLGRQPRSGLGAHYSSADVVCVPSRSEPQATVVLEALVAGSPVVASDAGGNPFMVRDGENGLLFPAGDAAALAAALGRMASDAALLDRLTRAARASVWPEFSWERRGARLAEVMVELIAEGGRR